MEFYLQMNLTVSWRDSEMANREGDFENMAWLFENFLKCLCRVIMVIKCSILTITIVFLVMQGLSSSTSISLVLFTNCSPRTTKYILVP